MKTRYLLSAFLLAQLCLSACAAPSEAPDLKIRFDSYGYRVVKRYPHDPDAFTQGLVYHDGYLLETTGLRGQSRLMRVELSSGKALKTVKLDKRYFGEGLTLLGNRLYQLTYKADIGFVYDAGSFETIKTFNYKGEGWGLTNDGKRLIMSDGSATLSFLDPKDFKLLAQVEVHDTQGPVKYLNELEYIEGMVWANLWYSDEIAVIRPDTGQIVSRIDLSDLTPSDNPNDVLNGIAYDQDSHRLFVTGKRWSALFEIELVAKPDAKPLPTP